ncbi:ephrin-B1-like protein [Leptotrombidium deliense]|uniref:Ephrin-B1-like protein n=1 Tax=Leptotrombidium deliense TaxID=299467 RepID=A0A443SNM4_9ACAR|nr:ephrin-B1-like protein [Leptotrombidium deliense]
MQTRIGERMNIIFLLNGLLDGVAGSSVSKEEYDSCRITNSNARKIAICDKPQQLMYFTITFRSFTPQPGGLEFKPGQDYYFISTSDGRPDGIDHRYVIPGVKHNNNNNNDVPRSDQEWTPRRADDTAKSDSGAWLTGVAVIKLNS